MKSNPIALFGHFVGEGLIQEKNNVFTGIFSEPKSRKTGPVKLH